MLLPKKEFFISDVHFPYHLKPAWSVILKLIKHAQPDLLYFGGDCADPQSLSRHPKKPIEKLRLQWELAEVRAEFTKIRNAAPNSKWRYRIGNHEAWLQRYLNEKAEELSDLDELKLWALLRFEQYGIREVEEGEREQIGRLWHLHGHELKLAGKYPARSLLNKIHANAIAGHVHKFDVAYERDYDGSLKGCWTNGCVVPLNPDWSHHTDWSLGFSEVEYVRGGYFRVNQIPIHFDGGTYFAVYAGRIFEAIEQQVGSGEVISLMNKKKIA